jgi:hypothetical protein
MTATAANKKKYHQTGVLLIVCQELLLYKSLKKTECSLNRHEEEDMRKFWEKTS